MCCIRLRRNKSSLAVSEDAASCQHHLPWGFWALLKRLVTKSAGPELFDVFIPLFLWGQNSLSHKEGGEHTAVWVLGCWPGSAHSTPLPLYSQAPGRSPVVPHISQLFTWKSAAPLSDVNSHWHFCSAHSIAAGIFTKRLTEATLL